MRTRITQSNLEAIVRRLNAMFGVGNELYASERDAEGNMVTNPGVYYLDGAYGGYRLSKTKGLCDVCNTGYVSKRELYNAMFTYIAGLRAGARNADVLNR